MNWLQKPSTTGGIIYLSVVSILLVGLGVVLAGGWRTGVALMSLGFGVAFVARSVLPDHRAGMLRVRRRFVDLTTMAICCVAMFVLSVVIPNRS